MTTEGTELRLHEQLMLLALRDKEGTLESKAGNYRYALAGALLAELALSERIKIGEDKKQMVDHLSKRPLRDPILDDCLELVANAKRRRRAANWVARFVSIKRLRHRVAEQLCRRRVLKDSEESVLLFFTRKLYPTIDPVPEKELVERLRGAIFSHQREIDPRTSILVGLADATGLLRVHFDRKELKKQKERLERISSGDMVAGAAREAIRAAQAAQIAVIAATTAASTASAAVAAG